MLPRSPAWSTSPWSRRSASWPTTIDSPRVARTISRRPATSGVARSSRAPSRPRVSAAASQIAAISGSTGSRPPRSGVKATRRPVTSGAAAAAGNAAVSTS